MTLERINSTTVRYPSQYSGESTRGPKRSFTKIPNSILDDPELTCQEKMSYIVLLSFGFQKKKCWPPQKLIAEKTKISRRHIRRILTSLNHKGYIIAEKKVGQRSIYNLLK